jgi:hypothetical protein
MPGARSSASPPKAQATQKSRNDCTAAHCHRATRIRPCAPARGSANRGSVDRVDDHRQHREFVKEAIKHPATVLSGPDISMPTDRQRKE